MIKHVKNLLLLAAGMALLVGCHPPAGQSSAPTVIQPKSTGMFVFIQAGDPQMGVHGDIAKDRDNLKKLAAIVNDIAPEFVIFVGDMVHNHAASNEWDALKDAISQFKVPVRAVPGNHDDLAAFRNAFGPDYYSFVQGNTLFICLNSNLFSLNAEKPGAEEKKQWDWLEETLVSAQARKYDNVIMVMHHPPILEAKGKDRLLALVEKYGVKTILAGHTHRSDVYEHDNYKIYTVAGTSSHILDSQGQGYRVFVVMPQGLTQEYRKLDK